MIMLNKPGFSLLERSLDAASLRQNVIANNIANVDTPYFKRSDVSFEEMLQNETNGLVGIQGQRTNSRHFAIGQSDEGTKPQIKLDEQSVINNNNNNVDIDTEMSLLAKNQLRYNVMIQQMNTEFKHFRTALNGGK
ncbi:flagellar basal body rod protein FlgB [Paenibacillus aurantius]|uniref:Flagellar basal body rod protein FlgB n=1 Tax=Paenibacillus aurantius TaxID=2918900 RepID=A0AA96LM32_9BACL|nr:flagellar basal body rod protein FlgB [Paenibacillus aurantius]WNQ13727.1 flagellar basal body rod protein FlgB [Paenibacillus aurantius]